MFRPLLFILVTAGTAFSTILLLNSPDHQLPPVARVNEPYSWTLSPSTFDFSDGSAQITASFEPSWLSFDSETQTFYGTPSEQDEGAVDVKIRASDGDSSVSSCVTLVVSSSPAPTLRQSIQEQFYAGNPSLSSVFPLSPGSAIVTANPTLRIPPGWSFSIGFQGDMFDSVRSLSYDALQSDDSPLFDWMVFNPNTMTLNGVTPELGYSFPQVLSLNLHVSDHEGYTSSALPFDIVISPDELSSPSQCLPTINITASTPFNLSLFSPNDFHGVLVDGNPIRSSDISTLSIDVTQYAAWLKYDEAGRTLSGTPPDDLVSPSHLLPVTLTATFNQTLSTTVSLAIVPSYFSSQTLTPIHVAEQDPVHFNLVQYFSNATAPGNQNDVNLTAAFEPDLAGAYLIFDPGTAQLSGSIPVNCSLDLLSVTFTAYSRITHSTSHTTLPISILSHQSNKKDISHSHPRGLSASAHAQLVLGLALAFGLVGGLALLGTFFAALRRCARVSDTALGAEAAKNAWTDNDRKWYGIGIENGEDSKFKHGYGWTEKVGRLAMDIENPFSPGLSQASETRNGYQKDGGLGLVLQRVLTRTPSNSQVGYFSGGHVRSPGAVMRKAEFLGKIKETVRKVSDKYAPGKPTHRRPAIGKPVLVALMDSINGNEDEILPFENASARETAENPFEDVDLRNYAASTVATLSESPTSSTEDRSIPRRRADFAPVKSPLVHSKNTSDPTGTGDVGHGRNLSTDSDSSLATNSSARRHAEEAVVQTATRATSVRSTRTASAVSYQSLLLESPELASTRPRLMPFTSATRVPVPQLPSGSLAVDASNSRSARSGANPRVASQTATVIEPDKGGALDDLSVGIHYVRSLGGDRRTSGGNTSAVFYADPSTHTVSTNVRSSFSSLASSRQGKVKRFLVRTGEKFKFKVAVTGDVLGRVLVARLISGGLVPQFVKVEVEEVVRRRGMVEFSGIPEASDIGEVNVGVFTSDDGECVARVIIEVVGRSS